MPRTIKKYDPTSNKSLNLSMYGFDLLTKWYKEGLGYTIPYEEGKLLDLRVFEPAVAKGLFATDRKVWWMTEAGRTFTEKYTTASAWKSVPSLRFGSLIESLNAIAFLENRKKERQKAQEQSKPRVVQMSPKRKVRQRPLSKSIKVKSSSKVKGRYAS